MAFKQITPLGASFNSDLSCNFKSLLDKAILDSYKKKESHKPSKTIAPSSLRCERLTYFRLRGVDPDEEISVDRGLEFSAFIGSSCHEMLQKQFDVNVFGAIRVAQKALPMMLADDVRIVNISSMASYGIFPFVSPYCVSKRALDMFFNFLLLENKNPALKIISIKPGVVATPIWNKSVDAIEECFGSISENVREKYGKELEFLAQNARGNENKGLKSEDIANLVYKVLCIKNPKLSYNIGKDSYFARFMSFLPLWFSNKLVKFGLKKRIS